MIRGRHALLRDGGMIRNPKPEENGHLSSVQVCTTEDGRRKLGKYRHFVYMRSSFPPTPNAFNQTLTGRPGTCFVNIRDLYNYDN